VREDENENNNRQKKKKKGERQDIPAVKRESRSVSAELVPKLV